MGNGRYMHIASPHTAPCSSPRAAGALTAQAGWTVGGGSWREGAGGVLQGAWTPYPAYLSIPPTAALRSSWPSALPASTLPSPPPLPTPGTAEGARRRSASRCRRAVPPRGTPGTRRTTLAGGSSRRRRGRERLALSEGARVHFAATLAGRAVRGGVVFWRGHVRRFGPSPDGRGRGDLVLGTGACA